MRPPHPNPTLGPRMLLYLLLFLLHAFAFCCGLPLNNTTNGTAAPPLVKVTTSLGPISGVSLGATQRFTVPFAQPPVGTLRFAAPQPALPWSSTDTRDGSRTPPSCMQDPSELRGGNDASEDCLYLTVYRPSSVAGPAGSKRKLPVLVWIHGGSFVGGSSTAYGLDGSKLAAGGEMLVVLVQYRLGAFGFLQTEATLDEAAVASTSDKVPGNQGVRDVVEALAFIHANVAAFGGDPGAITVAGQSSGAHMVRTLLTLPAATPLFRRAILHSDPANYGPASAASNNELGDYVLSQLECGDLACARGKSAEELLAASEAARQALPRQDGAIAQGEPWRPMPGSYLPSGLESSKRVLGAGKQVIFTTVSNEAGSIVGSMLQPTVAGQKDLYLTDAYGDLALVPLTRSAVLEQMFNNGRGFQLDNSSAYPAQFDAPDGLRASIDQIGTDGLYRCATWHNIAAAASSSTTYLAVHHTGITYPSNADNAYCTDPTRVCHEDDIYALFDSAPSPSSARQTRYATELRKRWIAFIKTGNPNTQNYTGWKAAATASNGSQNVLQLGSIDDGSSSLQSVKMGVCSDVWGSKVLFDWQMYA